MAGAVADISLRAGDAGGEPLAVLHGNKPVLAAMPDLDGHPDVAEVEPPACQLRRAVIPPALVARTQSDLVCFGEPLGQVPGQNLGVDGRGGSRAHQRTVPAWPRESLPWPCGDR